MTSKHFLARSAVATVTGLALLSGTAGVASAKALTTGSTTAAEHCRAEKQDVKAAKKAVTKAIKSKAKAKGKQAKAEATKNVKAAKATLKTEKAQKKRWCALAEDGSPAPQSPAQKNATKAADVKANQFTALIKVLDSTPLPPEAKAPLKAALLQVLEQLDGLTTQIQSARPGQLDSILAQVQAMDPTGLSSALSELKSQLSSMGADPTALFGALSGAGVSGLPAGSPLAELQGALHQLVDQIQAYDPTGQSAHLDEVLSAVDQLTAQLDSSAVQTQITDLVTKLQELGANPTPDAFIGLLTGLLGGDSSRLPIDLPGSLAGLGDFGDLLGSLDGLLGGNVTLPTANDLWGADAVADILTGIPGLGDLLGLLPGGGSTVGSTPLDQLGGLLGGLFGGLFG